MCFNSDLNVKKLVLFDIFNTAHTWVYEVLDIKTNKLDCVSLSHGVLNETQYENDCYIFQSVTWITMQSK